MIYTKDVNKAIKLMYEKHKNQVDKEGIPYVFHPWHVAESMDDEDSTIVALLHDIIEDTDTTIDDLINMRFNEKVINAIRLMTHSKSEPYDEYIKRIGTNPIATKVKLADLKHNMDKSRISELTLNYLEKLNLYKESFDYLSNINN